jgi:pyruvate formate lyase activating enzyme
MELLDGIVLSGGEPLAQERLPEAIRILARLGFPVGLHTGGAFPERLEAVLPEVSWVGFDLKAPWDRYDRITGSTSSGQAARRSLELLKVSGLPFELRTTVHAALTTPEDLEAMADIARDSGANDWAIQHFRGTGCSGSGLLEDGSWGPDHESALARIRRRMPSLPMSLRGFPPVALSA